MSTISCFPKLHKS